MTSLSLPSQGPAQLAHGAASVLAGDRGSGSAPDSGSSAEFDAMLSGFGDSATQPHATNQPVAGETASGASTLPATAPIAENTAALSSWRAVSARHSLGSGVLIALDKRLDPTGSKDQTRTAAKELKSDAGSAPDATALTGAAWAMLIGGANGATGATAPPSSPAPPLAGLGSSATAVSAAAPAPVEVKVVRSITYLGLDPTAPSIPSTPSASLQSRAKNALSVEPAQADLSEPAPSVPVHAQANAPATSSGSPSNPDSHGSGANGGMANNSGAKGEAEAGGAQGAAAAAASGIAQTGPGAIFANSQMLVPVDQLAEVVASAAQDLGAQSSDAAGPNAAVNGAVAARTAPVKELDVQLNPASLGAVSIQMRLSNGALSVSIKADQTDTLQLIDNQRGAIADKLKSLNFSVDSLTVKASDAPPASAANVDSSNTGTSNYGEAQQGQSGQSADGSREGRLWQGDGGQRQSPRQNPAFASDAGGDGNFGHRVV
jgi:chemotaxis protein MotD